MVVWLRVLSLTAELKEEHATPRVLGGVDCMVQTLEGLGAGCSEVSDFRRIPIRRD
ncbi:MAG: hypothetical protein AAF664_00260 [Planctomycetota bacterium]